MAMRAFDLGLGRLRAELVGVGRIPSMRFWTRTAAACCPDTQDGRGTRRRVRRRRAPARWNRPHPGVGAGRQHARVLRHRPAAGGGAFHHGAHGDGARRATAWPNWAPARKTSWPGCASASSTWRARTFNLDSPKQLAHILFEVMGLTPLEEEPAGLLHRRRCAQGAVEDPRNAGAAAALPRAFQDQVHLHRRAAAHAGHRRARAHLLQRDGHHHGAPVVVRPEPAEHPRAHRVRPPASGSASRPLASGSTFLSADYSQIELRLLAHLSGDEHLVQRLLSGRRLPCQHRQRACSACRWKT